MATVNTHLSLSGERNLVVFSAPDGTARPIGGLGDDGAAAEALSVRAYDAGDRGSLCFANGKGHRNRIYIFPKAPGSPEIVRVLGFAPPQPPSPPPPPPFPPPPPPLPPNPLPPFSPPPPPPDPEMYFSEVYICRSEMEKRQTYKKCHTECTRPSLDTDGASHVTAINDWYTAALHLHVKYAFMQNTDDDDIWIGAETLPSGRYIWSGLSTVEGDVFVPSAGGPGPSLDTTDVSKGIINMWCLEVTESRRLTETAETAETKTNSTTTNRRRNAVATAIGAAGLTLFGISMFGLGGGGGGENVAATFDNFGGGDMHDFAGDESMLYCWRPRTLDFRAPACSCARIKQHSPCVKSGNSNPYNDYTDNWSWTSVWFLPNAWVPLIVPNRYIEARQADENNADIEWWRLTHNEVILKRREAGKPRKWQWSDANHLYEAYVHRYETTGEWRSNLYVPNRMSFFFHIENEKHGLPKHDFPVHGMEHDLDDLKDTAENLGRRRRRRLKTHHENTSLAIDPQTQTRHLLIQSKGRSILQKHPFRPKHRQLRMVENDQLLDVRDFDHLMKKMHTTLDTDDFLRHTWMSPRHPVEEIALCEFVDHYQLDQNLTRLYVFYLEHIGGWPWSFPQMQQALSLGQGIPYEKGAAGPIPGSVDDPPPAAKDKMKLSMRCLYIKKTLQIYILRMAKNKMCMKLGT